MPTRHLLTATLCATFLVGCASKQSIAQEKKQAVSKEPSGAVEEAAVVPTKAEPKEEAIDQDALRTRYAWLDFSDDLPELSTLERYIPTPKGYTRQEVTPGSYAAYLRGLPVRTDREDVLFYTGEEANMPSAAVIPLDLGKRDLHQCADSVIRLYAEYLWSVDRASEAQFHYTSGDLARWKDWRKGKVLKIKGRKVVQVKTKATPNTHKAYRKWLDKVFMYASTRSLHRDSKRIKESGTLQSGDFFLQGGSPGHVIMILDIIQGADGTRWAMLGQGYLPAREFHVINGEGDDVVGGVWYKLSDEGVLATPTWKPFGMDDAWRFDF